MSLPLITEPEALAEIVNKVVAGGQSLADLNLRLVDLRPADLYRQGHIPGAIHADAALLNRVEPPTGGLTPEPSAIQALLQQIGANLGDQIIAYDGGRETPAARLIWVLDAYGYEASSWLNGGFKLWQQLGLPVDQEIPEISPGNLSLSFIGDNVMSADDLMQQLEANAVQVLDVRSLAEYQGTDVRSARGGHVPGARHIEWTQQLDDAGRLLDKDQLESQLKNVGITPESPVVVYCQTHQRSAVTYLILKHLGYEQVIALDGAWSNWGNRSDTPIETA